MDTVSAACNSRNVNADGQRQRYRRGAVVLTFILTAVLLDASGSITFVPSPPAAERYEQTGLQIQNSEDSTGRRLTLTGAVAGVTGLWESQTIPAKADEGTFDVVMNINLGGDSPKEASITIRVHPEWAPRGAAQFKRLVENGWYDNEGVFRVVPGFVAQFGLPAVAQKQLDNIPDDPVKVTNSRGTLVFATAGPNTRTSQLFFNYKDNSFLDRQGFSPFAEVLDNGMEVVGKFYAGYGERPNQGRITSQGNAYLDKEFPKLTKILKATVKN